MRGWRRWTGFIGVLSAGCFMISLSLYVVAWQRAPEFEPVLLPVLHVLLSASGQRVYDRWVFWLSLALSSALWGVAIYCVWALMRRYGWASSDRWITAVGVLVLTWSGVFAASLFLLNLGGSTFFMIEHDRRTMHFLETAQSRPIDVRINGQGPPGVLVSGSGYPGGPVARLCAATLDAIMLPTRTVGLWIPPGGSNRFSLSHIALNSLLWALILYGMWSGTQVLRRRRQGT